MGLLHGQREDAAHGQQASTELASGPEHAEVRAATPVESPTYAAAVEAALSQGALLDRLSDALDTHARTELRAAGAPVRERRRIEGLQQRVRGQRERLAGPLGQLEAGGLEAGVTAPLPRIEGIGLLADALDEVSVERTRHLRHKATAAWRLDPEQQLDAATGQPGADTSVAEVETEQAPVGGEQQVAGPRQIRPPRPFRRVAAERLAEAGSVAGELQELEAHRAEVETRHQQEQADIAARQQAADRRRAVAAERAEAARQAEQVALEREREQQQVRAAGTRPLSLRWATKVLGDTDLGWAEGRSRGQPPLAYVSGELEHRTTRAAGEGEQQLRQLGDELARDRQLPLAVKVVIAAVLLTAGVAVLGTVVMSGFTALLLAALFLRRWTAGPGGAAGAADADAAGAGGGPPDGDADADDGAVDTDPDDGAAAAAAADADPGAGVGGEVARRDVGEEEADLERG